MITNIEKSYIAGFFDADGSVTVTTGRKTKKYPIYVIALCFYNNSREILEWFQDKVGGHIYYRPRRNRPRHANASMLYMRTQSEVLYCLSAILPYLRVKKVSAKLAYQYLQLREPTKHLHSAHNPITDTQFNILKELRLENMKRSCQAKPL